MAATRVIVSVNCLPVEQRCVGRPRNLARLVQTAVSEFVKQDIIRYYSYYVQKSILCYTPSCLAVEGH